MAEDLNDDWWEEKPVSKKARKEEAGDKKATSAAKRAKKQANVSAPPPAAAEVEDETPKITPKLPESAVAPVGKQKKAGRKQFVNPVLANRALLGSTQEAARILWDEVEKALGSGVSVVELETIHIDGSHMVQPDIEYTGDWALIGDFLRKALPDGQKVLQDEAALRARHPRVLLITGSATRGCDFVRGLNGIRSTMIGRFFAKHMKFAQQIEFMEQHKFAFAVGTPGRITKLHTEGGLKFDDLQLVIIDYAYVDVKSRNVFQIPEVQRDLGALLRAHVLPKCITGSLRLALF
eukprot:m.75663 g.75663  ORF g.75663 m.75663 type:complete len:293 (-) comp13140_c0_seq4:56-934(-)